MSTLMELYIAFMKIGFTSFGGTSIVPLILEEMRAHHWMTTEDLTNVIAIAEMTPGPLESTYSICRKETGGVFGGIGSSDRYDCACIHSDFVDSDLF